MENKIRNRELCSHIEEINGCLYFYIPLSEKSIRERHMKDMQDGMKRDAHFVILVNEV